MEELTDKQKAFCEEYLIDFNGTQSAIRAGLEPQQPLKYYVYMLINSLDGKIFYIGKGKGKRVSQHVKNAKAKRIDNAIKHQAIVDVLSSGGKVIEYIFASNLNESQAYALEGSLIKTFMNHGLTNISNGTRTALESSIARARILLDRLKPFDDWARDITPQQRHTVETVGESCKAFYDRITGELRILSNGNHLSQTGLIHG
jgi:hypothetical protein